MKRISTIMIASLLVMGTTAVAQSDPVPGKNGNKYVPYEERTGNESIVYFTRNLSAEGLIEAYEQVSADIKGHTGVKLHTGEQNGPNIIPREWVKALFRKDLSDANIVETNTYYEGDRYTTEQHRRTLEVNGWTFCPVDILDEEDTLTLPTTTPWWCLPISKDIHKAVSAEATRISVSAVRTGGSERPGFIPHRDRITNGISVKRNSWNA